MVCNIEKLVKLLNWYYWQKALRNYFLLYLLDIPNQRSLVNRVLVYRRERPIIDTDASHYKTIF